MHEILKPQLKKLRKQFGFKPLKGSLEDRITYIKRQINFMNMRLGRDQTIQKEDKPKVSSSLSDKLKQLKPKGK